MQNVQKISINKVAKWGARGLATTIPKVYAKDHDLASGMFIEIFRGQFDNRDVLIIFPPNKNEIQIDNKESAQI